MAAGLGFLSGGGVRSRAIFSSCHRLMRAAGGGKATSKAPAKAKKAKVESPVGPTVEKEIRNKSVLGENILKEGADPPVRPDSEYPNWLFSLLDRPLALSELERRDAQSMTMHELHRFVKLENRRRVKENNSLKAKT